jgi:chromosome segregation ATPase
MQQARETIRPGWRWVLIAFIGLQGIGLPGLRIVDGGPPLGLAQETVSSSEETGIPLEDYKALKTQSETLMETVKGLQEERRRLVEESEALRKEQAPAIAKVEELRQALADSEAKRTRLELAHQQSEQAYREGQAKLEEAYQKNKALQMALEASEQVKQKLRDSLVALETEKAVIQGKAEDPQSQGQTLDQGRLQLRALMKEMEELQQKLQDAIALEEDRPGPSSGSMPAR